MERFNERREEFDREFKLTKNITIGLFFATLLTMITFYALFCIACVAVIVAYTW